MCYTVDTAAHKVGEETPLQTQVRVFTERIEACQASYFEKPVVPWIQAPGQDYEDYMMDKESFLAILEAAHSLGIERIVIWAGSGYWDWGALLSAIEAFTQGHP